jgi:hypothetical protein
MAIMDSRMEFADEYDIATPGTAGTVLLTNQIDLGAELPDIGVGRTLYLVIAVGATEIITGGSAGTLTFRLVSDDSASIHATTCSKHYVSKDFVTDDAAANELDAGTLLVCVPLPAGGGAEPYERYLGVQAIIGTTTITAGTLNVYLTYDPPTQWRAYADATN